MALYSICSLFVDTDIEPSSYRPFLINGDNTCEDADLIIRRTNKPLLCKRLTKSVVLSDLIVWKNVISEKDYSWVFEARNGMFTIFVDKNYTSVKCYSLYTKDSLNFEFDNVLGEYLKIIIECKLVQRGFTILHSSCVEINGVAYAFTGPSGIGKSTRAGKWCELIGAEWISGDRPVIDAQSGFVYGVPWDGKEKIYRNVKYPLTAVLKVKRSTETRIFIMQNEDKLRLLCEQTFIPLWDTGLAAMSFLSLKHLIKKVAVFELSSDITNESSNQAYEIVTAYIDEIGGNG